MSVNVNKNQTSKYLDFRSQVLPVKYLNKKPYSHSIVAGGFELIS